MACFFVKTALWTVVWCGVALLLAATLTKGAEFKKPHPMPDRVCVQVRVGVAAYGLDTALKWARDQGYTSVQIMQAKRQCLTKGE